MGHQDRHFGLDLLRAAAILAVLMLHTEQGIPGIPGGLLFWTRYGWAGVDLFFVLSGYLIAGQALALEPDHPLRSCTGFWVRRWTRTLPLYYLVLLTYAFVKPVLFHAPFQGGSWRFVVFLQNMAPLRDFVQSWSLCIEEQFYLVFPLLLFFLRPRHAGWYLLPAALSLVLRAWAWHSLGMGTGVHDAMNPVALDAVFRFNTFRHLDGIAAGVFLAASASTWKQWHPRLRRGAGLLALAALLATPLVFDPTPGGLGAVLVFSWLAAIFAMLLLAADTFPVMPPGGRIVERIAVWSYGAYLWNNSVFRFMQRVPPGIPWWAAIILFLVVTLAISALTYQVVEKPGLRLRARLTPGRPTTVGARNPQSHIAA